MELLKLIAGWSAVIIIMSLMFCCAIAPLFHDTNDEEGVRIDEE